MRRTSVSAPSFTVDGKPAKTWRQLRKMKPPVVDKVDKVGKYI